MKKVSIELPEWVAEDAASEGLLSSEQATRLFSDELRRRRAAAWLSEFARLPNPEPPMSMEEIQAEVDAVRAERRARRASGT
jgi:hypothetical protein